MSKRNRKAITESEKLDHLVDALCEQMAPGMPNRDPLSHIGLPPIPSWLEIKGFDNNVREVLLPGINSDTRLDAGNITTHLKWHLNLVKEQATSLIEKALNYQAGENGSPVAPTQVQKEAAALAMAFLESLPAIRETLIEDVQAGHRGDPSSKGVKLVAIKSPGFYTVTTYRIANSLAKLKVPVIPEMLTELAKSVTAIEIHSEATIGPAFFIDHGAGTVIGQTATIGENVKLYQGVTLGAISFEQNKETSELIHGDYKRHPTLEDNVIVYANAVILGGDTTIGARAVIGAGCWVLESVKPDGRLKNPFPYYYTRPTEFRGSAGEGI